MPRHAMFTQRQWMAALALLNFLAAAAFADAPDWENEQVQHINTGPPRAAFIPFATVDEALNNDFTNSPFYFSLNGAWKFHWVGNPGERPTNFFQTNLDRKSTRLNSSHLG